MCRDRINRLMSAYTLAVSKNRTDKIDNYPENAAFADEYINQGLPCSLLCVVLLKSHIVIIY